MSRWIGVSSFAKQMTRPKALQWFVDISHDVRYAWRTLLNAPGFSAAMILTLALGVGANTAVFSVINTVLLKPLPYPDPDRIVMLTHTLHGRPVPGPVGTSPPKITAWRESTTAFTDVTAYTFGRSLDMTRPDQPRVVPIARVSREFFSLFGARLTRGRGFTAAEDQPGGPRVAVISDAFWTGALGARPDVIGHTLSLDGAPFTVVGVLDSGFDAETLGQSGTSTEAPAVWLPLQMNAESGSNLNYYVAAARLRRETPVNEAETQTAHAGDVVREKFPAVMPDDIGLGIERLQTVVVGEVRASLWLLWSAVALVLLIACTNTVSLLLVRAFTREREIAVRLAIGASRARLARQLITEGMVLAIAGGALGLIAGLFGTRAVLSMWAWSLPRIGVHGSRVALDWRVFALTLLTCAAIGILFGLVPAHRPCASISRTH